MLVSQSCLTLCDPMDCGPPGSSVQARILEWVAIPFSRMEYYRAIKRNEVLTSATTYMILEKVLSEEQKVTYYMILFKWSVYDVQIHRQKSRLMVAHRWEEGITGSDC